MVSKNVSNIVLVSDTNATEWIVYILNLDVVWVFLINERMILRMNWVMITFYKEFNFILVNILLENYYFIEILKRAWGGGLGTFLLAFASRKVPRSWPRAYLERYHFNIINKVGDIFFEWSSILSRLLRLLLLNGH